MTRFVLRYSLLVVVLISAWPLAAATVDDNNAENNAPAPAAWLQALLAEAQAAPVVPLALPCSPDCDALNGTACSPDGAKTTCYVYVSGTTCSSYTCRCSGGRWLCP